MKEKKKTDKSVTITVIILSIFICGLLAMAMYS